MFVGLSQFLKKTGLTGLHHSISPTLRLDSAELDALTAQYLQAGRSILFCCWHEITFVGFYWFRRRAAGVLMEASLKGDVLAAMANSYGMRDFRIADNPQDPQTVRGTVGFIKHLKAGHSGVIALDGPNGPRRIAKPGMVRIAEKTNAVIFPIGGAYARKIVFRKRWDQYQLPLWSSRAALRLVKPLEVPSGLTPEQEKALQEEIVDDLNEAMRRAEDAVKKPGV
ncbi:hypothetical protein NO1_0866 [Candidatus Termititenax aidoneus]|uniref:DUF374 domain-containing protein n=1 Tax=Termititenax aidoneus TaxID=2218524 RepID=A0A388TAL4_TERA1|nr:hypothetical protein NO1_0866 [Candidatus Termititenax aidoneus]